MSRTLTVSARRTLSQTISEEARRIGFDLVGIAPAVTPTGFHSFQQWLRSGYAGQMEYLPRREAAYSHPEHVLPAVRSVVMLAKNYRTAEPPPTGPGLGRVSRYAWGDSDYHDLLRDRLRQLADAIHQYAPDCRTRGIVDTAPLLERDFARLAGLGWFGKNTMLLNKQLGSWFFLAALLIDVELDYDQPHETSHCGSCTRCLEACPTDAFVEPYVLDATRCIAYLNIELSGPVPEELRAGIGSWLFGCDVCQDVCPWNRKPPRSREPDFQPRADLRPADAAMLLSLDETEFQTRFGKTALARPGRAGLLRTACIVLGNTGDHHAVPALVGALDDCQPVIRAAASWALGQLGGNDAAAALHSRAAVEDNPHVQVELQSALSCIGPPREGIDLESV